MSAAKSLEKRLSAIESSFFVEGVGWVSLNNFALNWVTSRDHEPASIKHRANLRMKPPSCPSNYSHFKTKTQTENFAFQLMPSLKLSVTASAWIIFIWVVFFSIEGQALVFCVIVKCLIYLLVFRNYRQKQECRNWQLNLAAFLNWCMPKNQDGIFL